jgi:hypothetical protein
VCRMWRNSSQTFRPGLWRRSNAWRIKPLPYVWPGHYWVVHIVYRLQTALYSESAASKSVSRHRAVARCVARNLTTHNAVYLLITKTRQSMCVSRNTEARSRNHCCRGKAVSITYSECVSVTLVIQHAKRMRGIILSSVACLVRLYFCTLSHKRHDSRGKSYWT